MLKQPINCNVGSYSSASEHFIFIKIDNGEEISKVES